MTRARPPFPRRGNDRRNEYERPRQRHRVDTRVRHRVRVDTRIRHRVRVETRTSKKKPAPLQEPKKSAPAQEGSKKLTDYWKIIPKKPEGNYPFCNEVGCKRKMQTYPWCHGLYWRHARKCDEKRQGREKARTKRGIPEKKRKGRARGVMCQQDEEAKEEKQTKTRCQFTPLSLASIDMPEKKKKRLKTMSEVLRDLKEKHVMPGVQEAGEARAKALATVTPQRRTSSSRKKPKTIVRCPGYDEHTQLAPLVVDEHVTEEGARLIPTPPSPTPLPVEWWRTSQVIGDSLVFYWTDGVSRVPDTSGVAADISEMKKVCMTF